MPQAHPSCYDALTELQGAFDSFAMGNYPYPSSYMGGALPAWPMRAACELLASPRLSSTQLLEVRMSSPPFLAHCMLSTKGHLERGLSPHLLASSSWHGGSTNRGTWRDCKQNRRLPVQAMAEVAGLLYNASGDVPCYNVTSLVGPAGPGATWLFQWCAQRAAQELPYFPATGRTDMFWYQG